MHRQKKLKIKTLRIILLVLLFSINIATKVYAEPIFPFRFEFGFEEAQNNKEVSASIQLLFLLTVLSLAPSILIMLTSFTRTIIVLSFLRNALGTQQMPPNQVLIGLALFLTFFIMAPVGQEINDKVIEPFNNGEIQQQVALDETSSILKSFMLKQFKNEKDLELFISLAGIPTPVDPKSLPMTVIIPAFLISELTIAFKIGFMIYIPFLIIDMIVSSTLMSMGMMMLPPAMISLPFKILLFIMVGGWNLISQTIITSFVR
jgi:flagellar biosynthetic protein FliP